MIICFTKGQDQAIWFWQSRKIVIYGIHVHMWHLLLGVHTFILPLVQWNTVWSCAVPIFLSGVNPFPVAHHPDWALCWEVGAVGQAGDPSVPHPGSTVPAVCCLSKDKAVCWRMCWIRPVSGFKHNSSHLWLLWSLGWEPSLGIAVTWDGHIIPHPISGQLCWVLQPCLRLFILDLSIE